MKAPDAVGTTAPLNRKEAEMHIELTHWREADEGQHVQCAADDAEITYVAFTAKHPVDGHEYGLMLKVLGVARSIGDIEPYFLETAARALDEYLRDNPEGES